MVIPVWIPYSSGNFRWTNFARPRNTILAANYCSNGNIDFSELFLGKSYDGKGSFSFRSQNRRTLLLPLPVSYPTFKPSITNTMPFDAAQLTAFWTSPDQMGLSARTRTQMASEVERVGDACRFRGLLWKVGSWCFGQAPVKTSQGPSWCCW